MIDNATNLTSYEFNTSNDPMFPNCYCPCSCGCVCTCIPDTSANHSASSGPAFMQDKGEINYRVLWFFQDNT